MSNELNFVKRCWVEVDLQVLKENLRLYRESLQSPHEIMAVVKANAYGHGDVQVSKTLQECGIRHFPLSLRGGAECDAFQNFVDCGH